MKLGMSIGLPQSHSAAQPDVGRHAALVLSIALVLAVVAAVQAGAVAVTASDWAHGWALLQSAEPAQTAQGSTYVLWHVRLPRVLFALLIGAAMALAGALVQGLFRNPLADAQLLGVTSGAACAAALVLTVFAAAQAAVPAPWRLWVLPLASFFGALGVCFLLERLARWLTPGSVAGLLLTGLAINAVAMAVVGLCSYVATDEQLRNLTFWTLGSLAGAQWSVVMVLALALPLAAVWALRLTTALNALALGEAVAGHVGIDVPRARWRIVVLVALLAALAVAWCGLIGFVGLIAPHLVRGAAGADHRRLVPLAIAAGALLMLLADTLARTVATPAEIPVGIFTALIGGPAFLLLLRSVVRRQGGHA
jgi:iron complex transport system permease protein